MEANGIGIKFAPYYRAYSIALSECGDRQKAIMVLEGGIRAEAQPFNVLQKTLAELKVEEKLGQGRSNTVVDDKVLIVQLYLPKQVCLLIMSRYNL